MRNKTLLIITPHTYLLRARLARAFDKQLTNHINCLSLKIDKLQKSLIPMPKICKSA